MEKDGKDEAARKKDVAAQRLQIKVADDMAKGCYSNVAFVHHSDNDFVLDFVYMEPGRPQGHVVARVITNPRAAKKLLGALQESVRRFEERLGGIELSESAAPPQGSYH